ncbi:hypothetical protein [Urbifossiella limnaea]|uniref:hypothetical protein n=1 Tax=Urbifossiella limnaea TaxID=2528023 RepID=UPI00192E599D|nr:hypothetical protein [Urbifossiella limnaea]
MLQPVHAGGETEAAPVVQAYPSRRPRCNTDFALDPAGGAARVGPTGWAVRADKHG